MFSASLAEPHPRAQAARGCGVMPEAGRGHVREQFVRTNCHSRARSRINVWRKRSSLVLCFTGAPRAEFGETLRRWNK